MINTCNEIFIVSPTSFIQFTYTIPYFSQNNKKKKTVFHNNDLLDTNIQFIKWYYTNYWYYIGIYCLADTSWNCCSCSWLITGLWYCNGNTCLFMSGSIPVSSSLLLFLEVYCFSWVSSSSIFSSESWMFEYHITLILYHRRLHQYLDTARHRKGRRLRKCNVNKITTYARPMFVIGSWLIISS